MKYYFDEKCFDELNEQSLYWLGFLYADGCIMERKNNYLITAIVLSNLDREILEQFKLFLKTNSPIKYTKNNNSGACRLNIYNQILNKKLLELGLIPRKSLIINFPKFLENHPLVHHFIRGYFDGDGCISKGKRETKYYLHLSMVGTENMMTSIMDIFYKHLNIHNRKLVKQGKVFSLHIDRKEDIQKVKNFLYKDANIFLKRKWEIFQNYSEEKFNTTSKYKGICFSKNNRQKWRVYFYDSFGKRKEKCGFKTEQDAFDFLQNLPQGFKISK